MRLLDSNALESSSVVANLNMNRERQLDGYVHELRFDPIAEAVARGARGTVPVWLDMCCGTGRALADAARTLRRRDDVALRIEGVDLVDMFAGSSDEDRLTLSACALERWVPSSEYALITCVHGLHYVGDKLGAIARLVATLAPRGLFVAQLDLGSFRGHRGQRAARAVASWLRGVGIDYDARGRLLRCEGPRELTVPFTYLGADDRAGPNYTGQPAVASHYAT